MANYLASIFGTEQDKVPTSPAPVLLLPHTSLTKNKTGQLLLLLQNRRLPPRRSLFTQARQTLLLANHPPTQPVPKPSLRPQEQDERQPAAEPLRRLL